jgi:transcriptional regulator with XRE-family HTH domain
VNVDSHIPSVECQILSDTGVRLKLLRELAGISQRELAKRAGITNSSISTIEQGQVSPSVQSLARILSAIPISFSDFFTFNPHSVVTGLTKASPRQLDARITVLSAQEAGSFASAAVDLSGVVLEGVLTLIQLGGTQRLVRGESFYLSCGQLFRFSNPGSSELRLFVCSLFERSH